MADSGTIRAEITSLESSVKTIESKKANAEKLKKKAKARRDRVKKFSNTLASDYDNNVRGINNTIDRASADFSDAVYGTSNLKTILENFEASKEVNVETDTNLSASGSCLLAEYNALNNYYNERSIEIDECNRKISSINSQIASKRWELTCALAEEAREEAERKARLLAESLKVSKKK